MKDTKEKIREIVNHAVYESGAGNDVLISQDIDELLTLIKEIGEEEYKKGYREAKKVERILNEK